MTTIEKIQDIFRDIFDDDLLIISPDTSADDIEDWDSLSHINLIVSVEKEFNIKFALGEIQSLNNIGEMMKLVEGKRG